MRSKLKDPLNIIIIVLIILNLLPLLAPIFMHLNLHFLSKPIYFIYGFFCHQFHDRSLHLYDHQYAWCVRDSGIWFGWLIVALGLKKQLIKPLKWYFLPIFILPILIDGGLQTVSTLKHLDQLGNLSDGAYLSNNLKRFVTGFLFGIGLAMFLLPFVSKIKDQKLKIKKQLFLQVALTAVIGVFFYIILIQLWSLTSKIYEPTNFLDSRAKANEEEFFARRINGECPTNNDILFNFQCFRP